MIIDQLPELTNTFDTDEIPIERGTNTYKTKISTFFSGLRDLIAARVAKSGDTMTGNLDIVDADLSVKTTSASAGTPPESQIVKPIISLKDSGNFMFGAIRGVFRTTGRVAIQLYAQATNSNANFLNLEVDSSGNRVVTISHPTAWLKALGLGSSAGALPITITQGGTEQTGTETESVISDIIQSNGSGWTTSNAVFSKWGKLAMIRFSATPDHNVTNAQEVVCTLKTGKIPVGVAPATSNLRVNPNVDIVNDGRVRINVKSGDTITASTAVYIQATYLLP